MIWTLISSVWFLSPTRGCDGARFDPDTPPRGEAPDCVATDRARSKLTEGAAGTAERPRGTAEFDMALALAATLFGVAGSEGKGGGGAED